MEKFTKRVVVLLGLWSGCGMLRADEPKLREFIPDRPDRTEGPYTVDAGHLQLETDLVNFTQDRGDGGLVRTWNFNQLNVKYGLTAQTDVEVIAPMFNVITTDTGTISGYGDTTVRAKWNFFGNDGGPLAMGVIPFVKIPTAGDGLGNRKTEGGLILPIALSLPRGFYAGTMMEVDLNKNSGDDGYHAEVVSSLTFSHELPGGLEAYTEIYSRSSAETGAPWLATFDAGLILDLSANAKLDAGVNLGLTSASDDLNPFLGLALRF